MHTFELKEENVFDFVSISKEHEAIAICFDSDDVDSLMHALMCIDITNIDGTNNDQSLLHAPSWRMHLWRHRNGRNEMMIYYRVCETSRCGHIRPFHSSLHYYYYPAIKIYWRSIAFGYCAEIHESSQIDYISSATDLSVSKWTSLTHIVTFNT